VEPEAAGFVEEPEEREGEIIVDEGGTPPRKYYFDDGHVEIATHLVYELDADGHQLRVVRLTDYTAEKVLTLYPSAADLRARWADPQHRADIIARLEERGITFDELAAAAKQPDADPFDLLCHLAFNAPLRTRRERADCVRRERKEFFDRYGAEARAVLNELLEKYAEHGTAQFMVPEVLKLPPIAERGNVIEIANLFGGEQTTTLYGTGNGRFCLGGCPGSARGAVDHHAGEELRS
jgi:type I restriction enzyme R subunit